jgi:catechol 2,3-dioxygenase-like lactoylglutathione lyase family enzyme
MPFKFSDCLALQTPDVDRVVAFYHRVMGLAISFQEDDSAELSAGPFRLFIDQGKHLGPIIEYLVPDVEIARQELVEAGCEVVLWEGAGERCYLRDPFGFLLNLYEDPTAFRKRS